ncbi:hypothetical protein K450DRAFT_222774 [Umbelopsis ramanniana AG]|uniref:C2H2-type domain-containing protein n=1 Tax=Umbelopsis ramanniana AG TaxID=1314678 RepID=A0AAD5EGZ7_UMBRA|nr:uncharacterized protein K450DRAFT_222774 [Umbelopsis ramanniana AG]KAI8583267.1 hypothetical protein K450DRAFT_222774 [Umbelopsis ramanniana AG]
MGRLRRSRTHHGIRDISRKFRTRAYTKDLDQIHEDLKEGNIEKMKNQPIDADKTGLGQHYCVPCARYFPNDDTLQKHEKSKLHKRRVKKTQEEPYTQKEVCVKSICRQQCRNEPLNNAILCRLMLQQA